MSSWIRSKRKAPYKPRKINSSSANSQPKRVIKVLADFVSFKKTMVKVYFIYFCRELLVASFKASSSIRLAEGESKGIVIGAN